MRLVTVAVGRIKRLGTVIDERVIDRRSATDALTPPRAGHDTPAFPADMLTLLRLGAPSRAAVRALLDMMGASDRTEPYVYDLSAVRLRAPPVFLQPGDEVVIEVTSLGWLSNKVIADTGDSA